MKTNRKRVQVTTQQAIVLRQEDGCLEGIKKQISVIVCLRV